MSVVKSLALVALSCTLLAPVHAALAQDAAPGPLWRPPLRFAFGDDSAPFTLTLFGFVEADFIVDSTRSYDDAIGASLVAHSDTYAGRSARSQFSVRNSRLGFMFSAPPVAGVKASALLEADFFGNQLPKPS